MKTRTKFIGALVVLLCAVTATYFFQNRRYDSIGAEPTLVHEISPGFAISTDVETHGDESRSNNVSPDMQNAFPVYGIDAASVSNLRTTFDQHYQAATDGNAKSMLKISYVARNCVFVGKRKSEEDLADIVLTVASGEAPEEMLTGIRSLLPDCSYIASHIPEETSVGDWGYDWLDKAAERGSTIAQLEILNRLDPSNRNYETSKRLLEDAVRTGDYQAFYNTSYFYGQYHNGNGNDVNQVENGKWYYLGCVHHPECDAAILRNNLEKIHYPSDMAEILDFAERWPQIKNQPEPFNFDTGWTE